MKQFFGTSAALALCASSAVAGGLDRSGQPITAIFEDGNYGEVSLGMVSPSVSSTGGTAHASGDVSPTYFQLGAAVKRDVSDNLSLGVIVDQPFGADVEYTMGALAGTEASVTSYGVTALARYKLDSGFSVHGGVRVISASGSIVNPLGPFASDYSSSTGVGYVAGAAYEIPDIAMRVAATYSSGVDMSLDGSVGNTLTVNLPKSLNVDFQTGIAADTLLFGSIRWAQWSQAALDDSLAGPLVTYTNDVTTYNLGVGRRFSDTLSGAVSLGYEATKGDPVSDLSPTDGNFSVGLGGTFTMASGAEVTGGVRYISLGDATTNAGSTFGDNHAIAGGVKIGFNF